MLHAGRPGRQLPGALVLLGTCPVHYGEVGGLDLLPVLVFEVCCEFRELGKFPGFPFAGTVLDFEVQGSMGLPRDCPGSRQLPQGFQAPAHYPKIQLRSMVASSFSTAYHSPPHHLNQRCVLNFSRVQVPVPQDDPGLWEGSYESHQRG